jgi:FixJ family two-component response regulator
VAVVDEDPGTPRGIQRLLTAHGFEVEAFPSAEAFLADGTSRDLTCLVLDIHLGDMSGIELRRRLADGSTIPVIFITAIDDEITKHEAIKAGCIAYLPKPFGARLLIDAVDKAAG